MSTLPLTDLSVPLRALRLIGSEFAHLPAPDVSLTPIYPDRLELSFHGDGFAEFEVWREALNLAPDDVVHRVQNGGETGVLSVHGVFAGARIELVGYAPVPELEPVVAGAGAVS
ncbi:hypothetical protein [Streptomyces qinzhouensis]|uniref:Uncharacterized protein n=1 Tax=Streptomyces qinzhouensis TaxID=2599401 RepID=A0A5B8J6V8_9ACTN|nr:hypothetical protein [Streptomyces qinzhouensis]QDY77535.1 hypothetical protein FQU76_14490 [Streptomyces qinzhouensis]